MLAQSNWSKDTTTRKSNVVVTNMINAVLNFTTMKTAVMTIMVNGVRKLENKLKLAQQRFVNSLNIESIY